MVAAFADAKEGGYFYASKDHEELFARSKDQYDGATPSGNSMAARNFVQLWRLTNDPRYRQLAESTFKCHAASLKMNPNGFCNHGGRLVGFPRSKQTQGAR